MSQQQAPKQRPQRPQAAQEQMPQAYAPQAQYQPAPQAPRSGGNPILGFFKALAWPFLKVGGWILGLLNVIIHEILRSTVRLIFSLVLFAIIIAFGAAYGYALIETNFDFGAAFPLMIDNFMGLIGQ